MSTRIYRLLLCLSPSEMRRRWEEEMVETFALQLVDHGFGAWVDVVIDLFRVALPRLATREALVIPFVSVAGCYSLFYGLIWTLGNSVKLLSLYHRVIDKFGG